MKKTEIIKSIKKENIKLYNLLIFLKNINTTPDNLTLNIKLVRITYNKIFKKETDLYLRKKINLKNLQKSIKYEFKNARYNSSKKIYNRIIYINDFLLKYYDILFKNNMYNDI